MLRRTLIYTIDTTPEQQVSGSGGDNNCAFHLSSMYEATRQAIINRLIAERNRRKFKDIMEIFHLSGENWNQTMHTMLMKFIGGFDNGAAAMNLSRRVTYPIIMRERSSRTAIEALLLGASGLLNLYNAKDEYVAHLKMEYDHLAAKYNIETMELSEWQLSKVRTQSHPTLQLAQLAACYVENEISMNSVTQCRSLDDIYRLFSGHASEYWLKHFIPNYTASDISSRFSKMKSEMLGINFVAQLIYAYGYYTLSPALNDQATELLRGIPAEKNRYITGWNRYSIVAHNAIDSQALIQLSREYCLRRRCHQCPVDRWFRCSQM